MSFCSVFAGFCCFLLVLVGFVGFLLGFGFCQDFVFVVCFLCFWKDFFE